MFKTPETLKDCAESGLDTALVRMENCHRLIEDYIRPRNTSVELSEVRQRLARRRATIYDVLRGLNREINAWGSDLMDIADDARARRRAERQR